MDENQNPEEAVKSGQDHLKEAAGNFTEAVSAKVENIRQEPQDKRQMSCERQRKTRLKNSEAWRRVLGLIRNPKRKVGKLKAKLTFAITPRRPS
jgi:hypothetical protein